MKGKTHDLNNDFTFSAHTINCVCHSIRLMFRVLGIYNFDHDRHSPDKWALLKHPPPASFMVKRMPTSFFDCAFIIQSLAYFILQIHHARSFKMRHILDFSSELSHIGKSQEGPGMGQDGTGQDIMTLKFRGPKSPGPKNIEKSRDSF